MGTSDSLITNYGSDSPFAEAYRYLRTNLRLSSLEANGKERRQIVEIVSARPGTGTSTTAANLAVSMAEVHQKVLLMDADLHRPGLDRLFGARTEPGLADVLAGRVTLQSALQPTYVSGLSLLAAGKARGITRGLFEIGIGEVFTNLRDLFEVIVVDTPAAAVFPDAIIMASYVDGVILVAKAQEPHTVAFENVRLRLEKAKVGILGVVLNNVQPQDEESLKYYRQYAVKN